LVEAGEKNPMAGSFNQLQAASAVKDRWHINDSPPDTPVSQEKEYYYGNNLLRNNAEGGPHTTYTNQERNPYTDLEAQKAQQEQQLRESRRMPQEDIPATKENWEHVFDGSEEKSTTPKKKAQFEHKILTGTAALQASSIPLNIGFEFPKTSNQADFTDPASRGFDPNKTRELDGPTNMHHMPTCCITGMPPMGILGLPSKSGPEPVAKGFKKKRPATAAAARGGTMAHKDFMRRVNSQMSSRPGTARPMSGRPMSARPMSARPMSVQ